MALFHSQSLCYVIYIFNYSLLASYLGLHRTNLGAWYTSATPSRRAGNTSMPSSFIRSHTDMLGLCPGLDSLHTTAMLANLIATSEVSPNKTRYSNHCSVRQGSQMNRAYRQRTMLCFHINVSRPLENVLRSCRHSQSRINLSWYIILFHLGRSCPWCKL